MNLKQKTEIGRRIVRAIEREIDTINGEGELKLEINEDGYYDTEFAVVEEGDECGDCIFSFGYESGNYDD